MLNLSTHCARVWLTFPIWVTFLLKDSSELKDPRIINDLTKLDNKVINTINHHNTYFILISRSIALPCFIFRILFLWVESYLSPGNRISLFQTSPTGGDSEYVFSQFLHTRSILKGSLTGMNADFSFFKTGCHTKINEPPVPNYWKAIYLDVNLSQE